MTDGRTDGPTNGPTNGRTDTPSYRDARKHLKRRGIDGGCELWKDERELQSRMVDWRKYAVITIYVKYQNGCFVDKGRASWKLLRSHQSVISDIVAAVQDAWE